MTDIKLDEAEVKQILFRRPPLKVKTFGDLPKDAVLGQDAKVFDTGYSFIFTDTGWAQFIGFTLEMRVNALERRVQELEAKAVQ